MILAFNNTICNGVSTRSLMNDTKRAEHSLKAFCMYSSILVYYYIWQLYRITQLILDFLWNTLNTENFRLFHKFYPCYSRNISLQIMKYEKPEFVLTCVGLQICMNNLGWRISPFIFSRNKNRLIIVFGKNRGFFHCHW